MLQRYETTIIIVGIVRLSTILYKLVVNNKQVPLQGPDKTRMYRIKTSQTVVIYNSIETQPGLYLLFNKVRIVATGKNKIAILWHHLVALYAVGCSILEVAETKIIKLDEVATLKQL